MYMYSVFMYLCSILEGKEVYVFFIFVDNCFFFVENLL